MNLAAVYFRTGITSDLSVCPSIYLHLLFTLPPVLSAALDVKIVVAFLQWQQQLLVIFYHLSSVDLLIFQRPCLKTSPQKKGLKKETQNDTLKWECHVMSWASFLLFCLKN